MNRRPRILTALALCAFSGFSAHAQTFTWTQTAGGTGYDWNNPLNWAPDTSFPDAAGSTANVNIDILGGQTIRLRQTITIGTLNLGDAEATTNSFGFTIGNASGENEFLTFDSGQANTSARISLGSTGTPTNTLAASVILNSNLSIDLGAGTQNLVISPAGSLVTGTETAAKNITVTNGNRGSNQFTINGDLTGDGVFINSSNAAVIINNTKSFTGTFVLNSGAGGSNTGSLTLTNGSIADAAEVIINGYLSGSTGPTQNGGSLHSGNGSGQSVTPVQRLTRNRITMNGGSLNAAGQALNGAALDTMVEDTVNAFDFNSGYSLLTTNAHSTSSGTRLNITTLERSQGATAFVRSSKLADTARVLIDNGSSFLKGAGGDEATTTMSIIPWMVASNTNGSAAASDTFATYTATGIRGLSTAGGVEYSGSITAGADHNVSAANVAVPAFETSVTVNSLRYTTSGTTNIGDGKTLIIASGGLIFTTGGTIGASGNTAAGTLQFGPDNIATEAVIWSNGVTTNTIGAAISGSAGLTKSGSGTLILTGSNTFSGPTNVAGGTLQVGDGINPSNLGVTGDVFISSGALLALFHGEAIDDEAILTLGQLGLFNGKLSLSEGVNETVGGLYFGDVFAAAGTYGSTASGATFQDDTFFSGPGILTVQSIPEPTTTGLLLGGLGALLMRRRQRRR